MTKQKPTKISIFGHFGSLNSGNEATLLAIVSRLQSLFPDCELSCICTSPENVVATHGIAAVPHTLRFTRIWDRRVPFAKRLGMAFVGLREELHEYVRASRALKGADVMIVPGTGILTDVWGFSGWGPYGLLKWSLMAKLRGCRVFFVSVGAGPVRGRAGRVLLRLALSLASYRSFRDVPSRDIVEDLGVGTRDDRIYPDLVFDLAPPPTQPRADRERVRPVVGLGLMEYSGRYSVADPSRETYVRYIESLAVFVGWLLDRDYDVKLVLGDADGFVIDDLRAELKERFGPHYAEDRVVDTPTGSVNDLLQQLSLTDVVVATRFHNALMSFLLGKPVVAISFHHKCSSLMAEMGLSDYCHDLNRMDTDRLITQFEAVVANANEVQRTIARHVDECRQALDDQYRLLFDELVDQPRSVHAETVTL
jgi:polysaccharide pyruvyl transferase WcaK-like protein